jgi:dipeptidase D
MSVLDNLEPKSVFHFFEEICEIPHGSFHTKKISDYCVAFAEERGLEVIQDQANNVIIKKPGTVDYEDSDPVIIQGHLDMVCAKTSDSTHDFEKDGLELYVEDGFVKAKDTSLGGDDGIAIAMALAVLDSKDIPHPPIEAVFTTDEEVGMGGAKALDLTRLKGHKLINIDSEDEGILTIGCAGGIMTDVKIPIHREKKAGSLVRIRIHGLLGGHSGVEIHKQRGNAHKMMGRLLSCIMKEIPADLVEVNGGQQDNVISLDSVAEILVPIDLVDKTLHIVDRMQQTWEEEFMGEEPGLTVDTVVSHDSTVDVCDKSSSDRVIAYLMICPNGVIEYSRKLAGLVETSLNLGIVETAYNYVKTVHMIRSSLNSRCTQIWEMIEKCAHLVSGEAVITNQYPAWPIKLDSELTRIMHDTYVDMYQSEPEVSTIHAGLECALFFVLRPDLDCVSFGPNILDIHSVSERLDIASTARCWEYLKEVLKRCK